MNALKVTEVYSQTVKMESSYFTTIEKNLCLNSAVEIDCLVFVCV